LSQPSRASTQGSKENILRISTPFPPSEPGSEDNNLTRYMEAPKASALIKHALKKDWGKKISTEYQNI